MALTKLIIGIILIFLFNFYKSDSQVELSVENLDNPAPGYIILDSYSEGYFTIIDNSGFIAFRKSINNIKTPNIFYQQQNGLFTFFENQKFYIINSSFILLDSFAFKNSIGTDSHDFKLTNNGHAFLLGLRYDTVDMSVIVSGGETNAVLRSSVIQEQDENKNVVWEWNSLNHYQITDATSDIDLTQKNISWVHANSIEIDKDGNVLLSSRDLDEITKINKQTGEMIWRLGGKECKNNQFTFLNDTVDGFWGFSHQHSIHRLANGNLLLFDNGNQKPNQYSRAVEYEIDEINKTIRKVWEYRLPLDVFCTSQGSVYRLSNGNTIIGWGSNIPQLTFTEVMPDGAKTIEGKDFISYQVMRYPICMASKLTLVQNTGNYNFSDTSNLTGVSLDITNMNGSGYVSVERHYYIPHNITYDVKPPAKTYGHRWVINNKGISQFTGKIQFKLSKIDSTDSLTDYKIYWRKKEGEGKFALLETKLNESLLTLESDINSFGEFILAKPLDSQTALLISPADNSTKNPIVLDLLWNKFSGADSYRLQISIDNNFAINLIDSLITKDTTLTLSGLENNNKYFWRLKSITANNETNWSNPWSFNTLLKTPKLIKPANDETDFPIKGLFEWDSITGVDHYKINISSDSNFNDIVVNDSSITITKFRLQIALKINSIYYWRVMALSSNNESLWSDTNTFTTEKSNMLNTPLLLSPVNDGTGLLFFGFLFWNQVSNAESYKLELSKNPNFQVNKISQKGINSPSIYYSELDYNTLYYWHVAAANQIDTSSWSDIWHFRTENIKVINEDSLTDIKVKYTLDRKIIITGDISEKLSYFKLFDITGRNIINQRLEQNHSLIDCTIYKNGIYIYFININSKSIRGKILIY